MTVPEWFLALAQKELSLAATRVGLTIFHAGTRTVDNDGNPIMRCQLPLSRLATLTQLDEKGVLRGIAELESVAGLARHRPLRARAPAAYCLPVLTTGNLPLVKNQGTGKIPLVKNQHSQVPCTGKMPALLEEGGGEEIPPIDNKGTPPPPPPPPGAASLAKNQGWADLVEDLALIGVGDASLFQQFPTEAVEEWAKWMLKQPQGRFRNPGGFIFRKLQEGKLPPAEVNPFVRSARASQYGHLYRH